MSLSGKVAIVTGGARGLGADIARGLCVKGAMVVIADIDAEGGAATASALAPNATFVRTDIAQDAEIDLCLAETLAVYGRFDILVNNACTYADKGFEATREEWLHTLNVNLVSGAVFAQKAVPQMTQPGGVIINMASTGGKFGAMGRALYPASKAAILQITRNEAVTFAPKGIRVLSVSPAWTWSPAVQSMAGTREKGDAVAARFHPLGRLGRGEDVACVIAFLCSQEAAFMSGVDVPVDGGFSVLGPDQGRAPREWFAAAVHRDAGAEEP